MKGLVKAFDDLPWILKLIFALPGLDGILCGIYRIAKGLSTNNMTLVIIGMIRVATLSSMRSTATMRVRLTNISHFRWVWEKCFSLQTASGFRQDYKIYRI